jgi:hypothetical protein
MPIYIKQLTVEERAVYGICPVCGAKQDEPCDMSEGVPLDVPAEFADVGTHTARLFNAPMRAAVSTEEISDATTPTR